MAQLVATYFLSSIRGLWGDNWHILKRDLHYGKFDEHLSELTRHFLTPHQAVDYIMDTLPMVQHKDEAAHGYYPTKDTGLDIYDAMQRAIATGEPYQTRLDPPPADPCCCHPPREAQGEPFCCD